MMTTSDSLAHYGTKGMKWGVRKEQVKTSLKKNGKNIAIGAGLTAAALSLAAGSAYIARSSTLKKVAVSQVNRDNDLVRNGMNFVAHMNSFNKLGSVDSEVNARSLYNFLMENTKANVSW